MDNENLPPPVGETPPVGIISPDKPMTASEVASDVLTQREIDEIRKEVNERIINGVMEEDMPKCATRNEEATRRLDESPERLDARGYELEQNPFQRDIRRIVFTNAYERLADKTQVCTKPVNAHITTRLVHTEHVAQISRAIARALGANEDLAEAIARGHDIGHAPLGHKGEELLTRAIFEVGGEEMLRRLGAFKHSTQSLHVVDRIASRGRRREHGLNLTNQVRHGIISHDGETSQRVVTPTGIKGNKELNADIDRYIKKVIHSLPPRGKKEEESLEQYMKKVKEAAKFRVIKKDETQKDIPLTEEDEAKNMVIKPATLEAAIVLMVDSIAYSADDFEDMVTLKTRERCELPPAVAQRLGTEGADIINALVNDLILHSSGKDSIQFSREVFDIFMQLRKFLEPAYKEVNNWVLANRGGYDRRMINIPPRGKMPQERMNDLFRKYSDAIKDPVNHTSSSILTGFFDSEKGDTHDYYRNMRHISGADEKAVEARIGQAVVDYIAGFTDGYFYSESQT